MLKISDKDFEQKLSENISDPERIIYIFEANRNKNRWRYLVCVTNLRLLFLDKNDSREGVFYQAYWNDVLRLNIGYREEYREKVKLLHIEGRRGAHSFTVFIGEDTSDDNWREFLEIVRRTIASVKIRECYG